MEHERLSALPASAARLQTDYRSSLSARDDVTDHALPQNVVNTAYRYNI